LHKNSTFNGEDRKAQYEGLTCTSFNSKFSQNVLWYTQCSRAISYYVK